MDAKKMFQFKHLLLLPACLLITQLFPVFINDDLVNYSKKIMMLKTSKNKNC